MICSSLNWEQEASPGEQQQSEPRHHGSSPYKVRPLSFMFWDKIRVDRDHFTDIRPPDCFKKQSRCLNKGKSEPRMSQQAETPNQFRKPASPVEGQAQKNVKQPSLRGTMGGVSHQNHSRASSPLPGDGTFVFLLGQHPLKAGLLREKLSEHDFP